MKNRSNSDEREFIDWLENRRNTQSRADSPRPQHDHSTFGDDQRRGVGEVMGMVPESPPSRAPPPNIHLERQRQQRAAQLAQEREAPSSRVATRLLGLFNAVAH